MGIFGKKKCPKCGSKDLSVIKESFIGKQKRIAANTAFPVRFMTGAAKAPKPLNICKNCDFEWEDR